MRETPIPDVSVVIPAYNAEMFIEDTLSSVAAQSYTNFECIIVDDASNDKTCSIVESFSKKDDRFRLIKAEHSGRPAVPRNIGIRATRAKYIAFLDSDDLWTKNKLRDQLKVLKNNSNIGLVYSVSVTFGEAGYCSNKFEVLPLPWRAFVRSEELIAKGNSIPCSSVVVKKEILESVGMFDEDVNLKAEDYDLWIRISKIANLHFISKLHVYYRISSSQFSGDWMQHQKRVNSVSEKHPELRTKYNFRRRDNLLFRIPRNITHIIYYFWLTGKKIIFG